MAVLIDQLFPSGDYYCQKVDFHSQFADSPLFDLLNTHKSELAEELRNYPDYFVMKKNREPETGAFFVIIFDGPIKMDARRKGFLQKYYPEQILLYAPEVPEYLWLKDYLAGKKPIPRLFSMR